MSDWKEEDLLAGEDFSLESILAEFKGDAYIASERKTPKAVLDQQTEEILGMAEAEAAPVPGERQRSTSVSTGTAFETTSPPKAPPAVEKEAQSAPQKRQRPADEKPLDAWPADDRSVSENLMDEQPADQEPADEKPMIKRSVDEGPVEVTPNGMAQKVVQFNVSDKPRDAQSSETAEPSQETKAPEQTPPEMPTAKKAMRVRLPKETDFTPASLDINDNQPGASPYSKYASYDAAEQEDPAGYDEADYDLDDESEEDEGLIRSILRRFSEGREAHHRAKELREEQMLADDKQEEGEYVLEEPEPEPDAMPLPVASVHYGKGRNALHLRGIVCMFLGLVMAWMCLACERGFPFPGPLQEHPMILVSVLLCLQLITMFAGLDIITLGIMDLFRLRPGTESLVMLSNVIIAVDAAVMMVRGDASAGLPYCAVGAFAMSFSLFGLKMVKNAMRITLKTASSASNPYIVTGKFGPVEDGYVLMKSRGETEGFLGKCEQSDFSEHVYEILAPFLIVAAAVLAFLVSFGGGRAKDFLHILAVLLTVGASFSGLMCYGLPFSMLAKKLAAAGAALAGWGGACEVDDAVGTIITDFDVFPSGTLSISGVRVFQKSAAEKVIAYTGSIIAESGSGLSEVFRDVMKKHNYRRYPISDFACYEGGGIGAVIDAEEIIIGSSNFMNLMGIRLPQNLNVKYAVFTAIDGQLAGVFSINYVPINSVQEALVTMLRSKLQPMFAIRDFNVTPLMLQQKFKISTDSIEFLTFEERYAISALAPNVRTRPAAILCREGLGPLADIVTGGRRLKQTVRNNVIFSLAWSLFGVLIMFLICWIGGMASASVSNVLIYMLAWLISIAVLSRFVLYN